MGQLSFRAKLTVTNVQGSEYGDKVNFEAQYSNEAEDNSFSQATPSASIEMAITNPDLMGKLMPGDQFYVDFTKIEK